MALRASTMNGGVGESPRKKNDFYATPEPGAVIGALFSVWRPDVLAIWEPACGNGALSTVLDDAGYLVINTDKNDYFYGLPGVDFFRVRVPEADTIITNPPFNLARKWIVHAKNIGIERMALLLPATFYNSVKGAESFEAWRPSFILPLTWRLDFNGLGRPVMNVQWIVWDAHEPRLDRPIYELLKKPKAHDRRII